MLQSVTESDVMQTHAPVFCYTVPTRLQCLAQGSTTSSKFLGNKWKTSPTITANVWPPAAQVGLCADLWRAPGRKIFKKSRFNKLMTDIQIIWIVTVY